MTSWARECEIFLFYSIKQIPKTFEIVLPIVHYSMLLIFSPSSCTLVQVNVSNSKGSKLKFLKFVLYLCVFVTL